MKYQPGLLDAFISPITGKLRSDSSLPSLQFNYTWMGDRNNVAVQSPVIQDLKLQIIDILTNLSQAQFILQTAKEGFGKSQALDQLQTGILKQTKGVISIAVPSQDYMPTDLTYKAIWRGDINGKAVESQDLTYLETVTIPSMESSIATLQSQVAGLLASVAAIEAEIAGLLAAVGVLQTEVSGLLASVAILQTEVSGLTIAVGILQGQIAGIILSISAINSRIDNLRLNNIPADGDVSFYNYKLINLADPVNQTDGVNLRTMQAAINSYVPNITLTGFVSGHSNSNGVIYTVPGPDCLLTNIPAGGDIDMECNSIRNLSSCVEEGGDAISAQFLWDLMHDEVEVKWA